MLFLGNKSFNKVAHIMLQSKIVISGNRKLKGKINIAGSKNAALPIMTASILTNQTLRLKNIPHISDISTMMNILGTLGVDFKIDGTADEHGSCSGKTIELNAANVKGYVAPYQLVVKIRASIWVLGVLLGRFGRAKVSLPGGCPIGQRPVDMHISAFQAMGADVNIEEGYIVAQAKRGRLRGAHIYFKQRSVGATENVLLGAVTAKGVTIIENPAMEPEVVDLAACLNSMGGKITGAGTNQILIEGVDELHSAEHTIIPDRIELGTYALAAVITNGDLILQNASIDFLQQILGELRTIGAAVELKPDGSLHIYRETKNINPIDICTQPYPGFPTDLQQPFSAVLSIANGTSTITETIFENRFMQVRELNRMGASIQVEGNKSIIQGVKKLQGANVIASDLRASVSLILAALAAHGTTTINNVHHVYRGYERIVEKLQRCGADIQISCFEDDNLQ